MQKHTRSTTRDLCVGFGSADVTTHAVLITITNHNFLYIKMPIFTACKFAHQAITDCCKLVH